MQRVPRMNVPRIAATLLVISACFISSSLAQEDRNLSWLDRASRTRSQQPDWVTPLFTASANLEEATIYDVTRKLEANGSALVTAGDARGVQFVPFGQFQITFGATPYLWHNEAKVHDGFGDTSFAFKYRFASGNAESGNFAFSGLVNTSIATGSYQNGQRSSVMTPTLLGEKASGPFNIQTAFGVSMPLGNTRSIGRQVSSNTAFQYRIGRLWYPELEANVQHAYGAASGAQTQAYLTPGILIGRFPIARSAGFAFGLGMQIAITPEHAYDHNLIFTIRVPLQSPRSQWAPPNARCGADAEVLSQRR